MPATYLPPANLKDFDQSATGQTLYAQWNAYMAKLVQGDAKQGNPTLTACQPSSTR